jgi:hypothetical protein
MQRKELLQTAYAGQASNFAATLNAVLGRMLLVPGNYVPEILAPDGPSTSGGVQSRQPVRLVPRVPGFPVLVIGAANPREGVAELRTFECVDAIHRHRFKRPLPIDRASFERMLKDAERLFETVGLRTTLVHEAPLNSTFPPPPVVAQSSSAVGAFVAGLLVMGLVAAFVIIWILRHR